MVLLTPSVPQSINGIGILHFGQQGTLGRYPMHFHFCGDVSGSVISKIAVRHSHQRCVVAHGSDNLLIQENVAYDTAGHCYMLEDGIETGNQFIRNIGAQTFAPSNRISDDESDDTPATFWITHPTNYFVENVAAGSESSGFWYELMKRGSRANAFPNLDPERDTLGSFIDNVAHSNGGKTVCETSNGGNV